jgi:hypothetical protein
VLRQGGLVAVLSFLDFFQTGVQRVAVATAAAMCRGLSGDSVEAVQSAVPILTNILQYEVRAACAWRFASIFQDTICRMPASIHACAHGQPACARCPP